MSSLRKTLLLFFALIAFFSCRSHRSVVAENVGIEVYTYDDHGKIQASAMPVLRAESSLNTYNRRFDYLLINVSEIHQPEKAAKRKQIWSLYPDTTELKRLYLKEFTRDRKLEGYFEITNAAITDKKHRIQTFFTADELMEVASKFFYCDQVLPDTSIQTHICIGLNGVAEAKWKSDYTLLAAFCYEAIFNDLDKDTSQVDEAYGAEKQAACQKYRSAITSLDQYLEDVKLELFARMKQDTVLKDVLLGYYEQNKRNLAFGIVR